MSNIGFSLKINVLISCFNHTAEFEENHLSATTVAYDIYSRVCDKIGSRCLISNCIDIVKIMYLDRFKSYSRFESLIQILECINYKILRDNFIIIVQRHNVRWVINNFDLVGLMRILCIRDLLETDMRCIMIALVLLKRQNKLNIFIKPINLNCCNNYDWCGDLRCKNKSWDEELYYTLY